MTTVAQKRNTQSAPKLVKRAEGQLPTIVGYAAVYYDANDPGTEYRLYSDMVERIKPGAFDRAVREDDVRGLFNHEECNVLGRTASGTMRLMTDARGLMYEIDPPDTQTGRDTVTSLQRGDVTGSSFMFLPLRTTWSEERTTDGKVTYIRTLEEVQLFDCGPVTFPAYDSTEAGTRSTSELEDVRAELEAWKRSKGDSTSDMQRDLDLIEVLAMEIELSETAG